jgi:hypothetical protein
MPLVSPPPARPLSRRARRMLALAGGILVIAVIGGIVWSAFTPGGYTSRAGCISVTLPSSTGGSLLHQCGATAKATCRRAFTHSDRISLLARPQCRLAGLAP